MPLAANDRHVREVRLEVPGEDNRDLLQPESRDQRTIIFAERVRKEDGIVMLPDVHDLVDVTVVPLPVIGQSYPEGQVQPAIPAIRDVSDLGPRRGVTSHEA